jgi:hypothetical protein
LDLHRCVAGNEQFFKEIFLAIWNAIAQFSANGQQHGFGASSEGGTPKWTGELMIALMQLPSALERCNVDAETQGMFMESIQTLGQVKVHLDFPKGKATIDEISERMAEAVEDWTEWEFEKFGKNVGVMLREFLLRVYPMKYSVDKNGRLRRQLSSSRQVFKAAGRSLTPGFLVVSLVGIAVMALIGFAAVRGMRAGGHTRLPEMEEADAESASENLFDDGCVE